MKASSFSEIIKIAGDKIEVPLVTPKADLEQNILFTSIGDYPIPNIMFEKIINIFSDKKYYLEFYLLTEQGIQRNNLGKIRNEITAKTPFVNVSKFISCWQKHYQDFAMKVLFVFTELKVNNLLFDSFLICNLLNNQWEAKVNNYVREHF